jgi:hypothetical protein
VPGGYAAGETGFAPGLMNGKPRTGAGFRKERGMLASPRFGDAEIAI